MHNLRENYGVGNKDIYNVKKQHEKLLKFYAESDSNKGITKCKTTHKARLAKLNKLAYKWFNT